MKKLVAMLLAAMTLFTCAQAETFTLHKGEDDYDWMDSNIYYEAETFAADVPEPLRTALDASPFAADEVLQGVWLREYYFKLEGRADVLSDQAALMAVRHEGKTVLLGASRIGGEWLVRMQSETFLRDGEDFTLTVMPEGLRKCTRASIAIVYSNESYLIGFGSPDMPWEVYRYQHLREDGVMEMLDLGYGSIAWYTENAEGSERQDWCVCRLPAYLEVLDADDIPASRQELAVWGRDHVINLEPHQAYMGGANLREAPTGSSNSLGQYERGTRVTILGQEPGKDFPWYHVRIGSTEGWVSGVYIYTDADDSNFLNAANEMQPAARVKRATTLCAAPSGEAIASLPAETELHVLTVCGSWAHVVVPRGELSWQADWDGDYGYVPLQDLTIAASPLQLRQTEDK